MSIFFPNETGSEIILTYSENQPYEYEFSPGKYLFQLWGGSGGGLSPGYGSFVSGVLYLRSQVRLYFYVGEKGQDGGSPTFNGGGSSGSKGSSGGGSSDIRLYNGSWANITSLKSRIIVASGGGGSQLTSYYITRWIWWNH